MDFFFEENKEPKILFYFLYFFFNSGVHFWLNFDHTYVLYGLKFNVNFRWGIIYTFAKSWSI